MSKEQNKKPKKDDDDIGEVSYTYWKRDSDIKADHQGFQPQATATPANINKNENRVGGAWNQAGTWEEKTITKNQFESFFNDYIKNNKKEYKGIFVFDEFTNYSGEVSLIYILILLIQTYFVFTRGKIKFFYDCSIKLKIKGIKDYENLDTVVTIKNLNNEDEDELPQYEYDSSDSKSSSKRFPLVQNFKDMKKEVESDILKIFDEMKSHYSKK